MYGCESWTTKKAECQQVMPSNYGARDNSWESFGQQGDQPVNPKGNQSWMFIGKTDAEVEAPIL